MLFTKVISRARAPLVRISTRNKSVAEKEGRIKELQELFTMEDGVAVHVKKGFTDKVLYQTTVGGCVIGLGIVLKSFYDMAFKKK